MKKIHPPKPPLCLAPLNFFANLVTYGSRCGICLLAACASVAPRSAHIPVTRLPPTQLPPAPQLPPALQPPALQPPPTTFAELLTTRMPVDPSESRSCLIAADMAGIRLAHPVTPATKQLPEPPQFPCTSIEQYSGSIRVLSPWGQLGRAELGPALVTATRVPARGVAAPAIALCLSSQGAWLRLVQNMDPSIPNAIMESIAAIAWLNAHAPPGTLVFLTAGARYPTSKLAKLLENFSTHLYPVLAVALPEDTLLPNPPKPEPTALQCAALPEASNALEAVELSQDALHTGLGPLAERIKSCMGAATAPPVGRVILAMRITGTQVSDACLTEDGIRNTVLATCLVQATQQLTFSGVPPGAYQDLHLPLLLAPEEPPPPQALCGE